MTHQEIIEALWAALENVQRVYDVHGSLPCTESGPAEGEDGLVIYTLGIALTHLDEAAGALEESAA